jgi:transposase
MDAHSYSSRVEILPVTDSGRRRRWSDEEKIRIVEESLARPRSVSATARRHEIPRTLLTRWRADYRAGLLGRPAAPSFVPLTVSAPPRSARASAGSGAKIEIVLANGRRLTVPAAIDPEVLARLLPVLDGA